MTKEELEKEAKERAKDYTENKERQVAYECGFLDGADVLEKENAELKEKLEKETVQRIYNLNKSIGWKEKHRRLKKENANLKNMIEQEHKAGNGEFWKSVWACKKGYADLEKENAELKEIIKKIEKVFYSGENTIKRLSKISDILAESEQLLSEVNK